MPQIEAINSTVYYSHHALTERREERVRGPGVKYSQKSVCVGGAAGVAGS